MLEHGEKNFEQQGCLYPCDKADATGISGMSATPLFGPQGYRELGGRFSDTRNEYRIVGHKVEDYPEGFIYGSALNRLR